MRLRTSIQRQYGRNIRHIHINHGCIRKRSGWVLPYEHYLPKNRVKTKYNSVEMMLNDGVSERRTGMRYVEETSEMAKQQRETEELKVLLNDANSISEIVRTFVAHHDAKDDEKSKMQRLEDRLNFGSKKFTPAEERDYRWYADRLIQIHSNDLGFEAARQVMDKYFESPRTIRTEIEVLNDTPLDIDEFFSKRSRSVDAFNLLLNVHAFRGTMISTRRVFRRMTTEGWIPNADSYATLMKCAGRLREYDVAGRVFNEMEHNGVAPTQSVFAAMIYAAARAKRYAKCFDYLDEVKRRELVITEEMYFPLLEGLYEGKHYERAEEVYSEMWAANVQPTPPTYCLMMKVAAKRRVPERAVQHATHMVHFRPPISWDVNLYNAMILAQASRPDTYDQVFHYFSQMITTRILPNIETFHALLTACANNGDLETGERVLQFMAVFHIQHTTHTKFHVLRVISKSQRWMKQMVGGQMLSLKDRQQLALDILATMKAKDVDVDILNAVLSCYSRPCHIQKSLRFFMTAFAEFRVKPNFFTYHLLIRMSTKTGKVLLMKHVKKLMEEAGFKPDMSCYRMLLYKFGKLGQFASAQKLVDEMEERGMLKDLAENERMFAVGEPIALNRLGMHRSTADRVSGKKVTNVPDFPFPLEKIRRRSPARKGETQWIREKPEGGVIRELSPNESI